MSLKEYEAANPLLPFKNSTNMKALANIVTSNAGTITDLYTLFRGLDEGHFLTIQADGAKIYAALGGLPADSINAFQTGTQNQVCYPIADGQTVVGANYAGREVSTGFATMINYRYLYLKVASGGVATAYARLQRSSLGPNDNPGAFKVPTGGVVT